jgi:SAM-dependent methyltransferase
MLDELMRRATQAGITNIAATHADARRLPFSNDTFDGAYLISVLGEIPDQEAALRELRRVLARGAGCSVRPPAREAPSSRPYWWTHLRNVPVVQPSRYCSTSFIRERNCCPGFAARSTSRICLQLHPCEEGNRYFGAALNLTARVAAHARRPDPLHRARGRLTAILVAFVLS